MFKLQKKMLENSSVLIEIQHVKPTSLKRNKSLFLAFLAQQDIVFLYESTPEFII